MQVTTGIERITPLVLLALPLTLAGCRRVEQRELYGSYVIEYETGVGFLNLEEKAVPQLVAAGVGARASRSVRPTRGHSAGLIIEPRRRWGSNDGG
jgi:hypothetical protein